MVITNRKINFDYHILTSFQAGIVLKSTEVKVLRMNQGSIMGSYASVIDNEVFLHNMHIPKYRFSREMHQEYRLRKLLLNRKEINKLIKSNEPNTTIIPAEVYFNERGYAKIKICLCKGKKEIDKRRSIKEKDIQRERSQALKLTKK